ncbi:MAG TPA: response regulator transcription factor [Rhodospirillaceae bacterium]|nr:response regulator transcription factor [Rhodospirillaceae bacterium]
MDALKHAGFGKCAEAANQPSFQEALEKTSFDLIIMVSEFGGFPMAPMISQMRLGRATHHPFPLVMMLLAEGEKDYVRKVIDCGPDYILLMPVAPGPVLARIEELTSHRRPFVVTFDYVGPDRRKEVRPGTEQLQQIEVPNPLAARVRGATEQQLQHQIDVARIRLHNLRMERYVVQLRWLGNTLKTIFQQAEVDPAKLPQFPERLKQIATELPALLRFDMNDQISAMLGRLVAGADMLARAGVEMGRQELDGLVGNCHAVAEVVKQLAPSA